MKARAALHQSAPRAAFIAIPAPELTLPDAQAERFSGFETTTAKDLAAKKAEEEAKKKAEKEAKQAAKAG